MKNVVPFRIGSEDLEHMTRGYVMAERINDVVAKPSSKRYRDYLRLVTQQYLGEPVIDHDDQYREAAKLLLPRALDHYEQRHGVNLTRGRLYFHGPEFPIAAVPDATEGHMIGLTVHIRESIETYQDAIERGVDNAMVRHAQAMMLITGLPHWIHLNYWEDATDRKRRLHEHALSFDKRHAATLEEALMGFVLKSRLRAAA